MISGIDFASFAAADNLVGRNINGWVVVEKLKKSTSPSDTGGHFSICYKVEKDHKTFFMKVLDYKDAFLGPISPGKDRAALIAEQFSAFKYEKELSLYCNSKKVSKVIQFVDSGQIEIQFPLFHISCMKWLKEIYETF